MGVLGIFYILGTAAQVVSDSGKQQEATKFGNQTLCVAKREQFLKLYQSIQLLYFIDIAFPLIIYCTPSDSIWDQGGLNTGHLQYQTQSSVVGTRTASLSMKGKEIKVE